MGRLSALPRVNVFEVQGSNAAAIQKAIDKAELVGGTVLFQPRDYAISTGLIVNSPNVTLEGNGANLVISSDIVPLTFSAPHWKLRDLGLKTTVDTTGPALLITGGANRYRCYDLRIEYGGVGGALFKYGVVNDGAYIGAFYSPYINPFAVSDIDMWFYDGSGIGTYPPNAISIFAPDIGGGTTGIKIEDSHGMEIIGGTIENNVYTKNVHVIDSKRVMISRVHFELPVGGSDVYFDNCEECVVDTPTPNRKFTLRSCKRCELRNVRLFTFDVDVLSEDTLILGGSPDSAGLTAELGTRTMLVGTQILNSGALLAQRSNGVTMFRTGHSGDTGESGYLRWSNGAVIIPSGTAGTLRPSSLDVLGRIGCQVITFAAGDTTPSVLTSNRCVTANASPTTITAFDDGTAGQEIVVRFNDANTTIAHNGNIKLVGGVAFVGTANDTLTLVQFSSIWYESARSVNG